MSRFITVAFRSVEGGDDCVQARPGSRFEGPAALDDVFHAGARNAGALSSIPGGKRPTANPLCPPHLAAYSAVPIEKNVRPIATTGTEAPQGASLP